MFFLELKNRTVSVPLGDNMVHRKGSLRKAASQFTPNSVLGSTLGTKTTPQSELNVMARWLS